MKHKADCACHDWPVAGDCSCGAELDAAKAEIERLRAALERIAALNDLSKDTGAAYGHLAECEDIARSALEGK